MSANSAIKTTVLFLCTGNSARSQLAEGLLRKLAGDRFEAMSAGLDPQGVHPLTVRVLEEMGIDPAAHRSKHIDEFIGRAKIDHSVIVCSRAHEHCPRVYPFSFRSHFWPFEDPAAAEGTEEQRLAKFREVRDQIEAKLRAWIAAPMEDESAAEAADSGPDALPRPNSN